MEALRYQIRAPEEDLLHQVIQDHRQAFFHALEEDPHRKSLPFHIHREIEAFLSCGMLVKGFSLWKCATCHEAKVVAFSCKRRGFCPSCAARRATERALNLTEYSLPTVPLRHWIISLPQPLRFMMAADPKLLKKITKLIIRAIKKIYRKKAHRLGVKDGMTGAICFLQRAGSDLRLNLHFHIIALDGAFDDDELYHDLGLEITDLDIAKMVQNVAKNTRKIIDPDHHDDNVIDLFPEYDSLESIQAASTQNKIALGQRAGKFVRYLTKLLTKGASKVTVKQDLCAALGGFSVHAARRVEASDQADKFDLISYASRGPIATKRLSLTSDGDILYDLKNKHGDKTHVILSPTEFLERIVAIIPPPWQNQVTYWGVLAPHHHKRAAILNAYPANGAVELASSDGPRNTKSSENDEAIEDEPKHHPAQEEERKARRRTWAELLKAVFKIDIEKCQCGGKLKLSAVIMEASQIERILRCLGLDPPHAIATTLSIPTYEI